MKSLQQRYLSLDVLRGLTVTLMIVANTPGNGGTTYWPLLHAQWNGFTPTDLIFATFLFAVGNALSFSIDKYAAMGNVAVFTKIFRRTLLIFGIGFLMYWFPFFKTDGMGSYWWFPIGETRILGVLQRIALTYCFASLILHFWKQRGALIFSIFALLGYWWVMHFYGDYSLTGNAGLVVDKMVLGENHMYHGEGLAFEPEGILSTLPSIVNVIAGYFAGRFIQKKEQVKHLFAKLIVVGVVCILVALAWDTVFPINKKLWTSSYVLVTVGLDLFLLTLLMYVIDVLQWRKWTYFFEVFGKNTLFIYLLSELGVVILFSIHVAGVTFDKWIYATVYRPLAGDYNGSLLFALSILLICWIVGYVLDKNKIYIKV